MYENGKIYKLCCLDPKVKDIYIGSTCDMTRRKSKHKNACVNPNNQSYNYQVYQFIRANGNWDNWKMIWVDDYPCKSKKELSAGERKYFELHKATLNTNVPSRTTKQYYQENAEELKAKTKIYQENNPDIRKNYRKNNAEKIKAQNKEYKQANAEIISQKMKIYYQEKKEEILQKQKIYEKKKIKCECGCEITIGSKKNHIKTKKHLNLLKSINQISLSTNERPQECDECVLQD